ncbi:MAG: CGNR zinc finger domain-containing protein [Nitrospira sp.]|nr:CGNR zinc finger domain-containing protein [Nitrospira sp.]
MTDEPIIGKIVSDEVFQFLGELAQASTRIGETNEDAMRWLLRFERCNLSTLSTGDWLNLRYELTAFRRHGVLTATNALTYIENIPMVSGHELDLPDNPAESLITKPETVDFQNVVKQIFETIRTKRPMTFTFPSLERHLYFDPNQSTLCMFGKAIERFPRWILRSVMKDPGESLLHWLLEFLKDNIDALRQCPESKHPACQGLFLADRTNKNFCSVTCQSRAATRRYRTEHGLRSGRPPGRPRRPIAVKSAAGKSKRRKPHGTSKR